MSKDNKLGDFLTEVSNWDWERYVKAERDRQYTTNQSIIFGLVRACAMQKLTAIQLSLNRLDGKLKTPVKIEYPKVFYVFPNAKLTAGDADIDVGESEIKLVPSPQDVIDALAPINDITLEEKDLPSMSLRETVAKMADFPRELPEQIVELALQTEQWLRHAADKPQEIPKVKSVVAAHLLTMAQNRKIDAITEVFDQIDGKLVETIQLLGEDIHIANYSTVAPAGAYLNKDGMLEIEATQIQEQWAQKLGKAD